ncbi:MAG: class I SAM-dependent methyltransferase [Tissierella sp.]|uniref:class I SAM-dependent methyltransferase n=1 Tax=Tissierella sp. TaxID=41274 RepID=UPI003F9DAC8E
MNCILCGNNTGLFQLFRENKYYKCSGCNSLMLDPKNYINVNQEKSRYEEHNNDVEDKGYQKFVSPIVNSILEDYKAEDTGLDFGSGTGPVISKLLKDKGYNIKEYDPFFANYPSRLEKRYDYIVCCEVVEHFHRPLDEFKLMKSLLKPGGTLYIMTSIYSEDIDFASWHYKNDITHVFFYHRDALEWIKNNLGFSSMTIEKDLIHFNI